MSTKKRALGRGLSALLESPETDITTKFDPSGNFIVGAIASIKTEQIETNPFQPRESFNDDTLTELSNSIREQGIIQPITVRKLGYDKYQLISGGRRLKAAEMAGLKEVPAYIRIANDQQMLELALIENIQREDLNPLDIAYSYQRLVEECSLTHESLSKRVSKDRTTISNYLRLLKLPNDIQVGLRDNKISMGHARAIINIEDPVIQKNIYRNILEKHLSVRNVEDMVKNLRREEKTIPSQDLPAEKLERYNHIIENLSNYLSSKVELRINNKGKGSIVILFDSDEDVERINNLINK